jgi:hypothetical protein
VLRASPIDFSNRSISTLRIVADWMASIGARTLQDMSLYGAAMAKLTSVEPESLAFRRGLFNPPNSRVFSRL